MNQVKKWSYSRYGTYCQCPMKFKFKVIDRLVEPGSPAMDRGTAIHKLAEDYVSSEVRPRKLPNELSFFGNELRLARKSKHFVEQEWGFTCEWKPCTWDDPACWLKAKADLGFWPFKKSPHWLVLVDHKTGKRRDEHANQLSLYALCAFIMFPEVTEITTQVWYHDQGKPVLEQHYVRDEVLTLTALWEQNTKSMFSDEIFAPNPTYFCRWCHFRKENGGPCSM